MKAAGRLAEQVRLSREFIDVERLARRWDRSGDGSPLGGRRSCIRVAMVLERAPAMTYESNMNEVARAGPRSWRLVPARVQQPRASPCLPAAEALRAPVSEPLGG